MNLSNYFQKAIEQGFALGAFNFNNMETLTAIVNACKKTNSPAILAVSESAIKYMGENMLMAMFNAVKTPHLFLHLDHGKSFEMCKKCIDLGFDSVMIDGSSLNFKDNIALTSKVVEYAHKKGVLVEGELGVLAGVEDEISAEQNIYTKPNDAKIFVQKTNVDSLAVAIGTSHGAYKYSGKQELKIDILQQIEKLLPTFPIVLHGASTVDENLISTINANGGDIKKAVGVNKQMLQFVIKNHNIAKINSDTDIRLALTAGVRKILNENKEVFDPRKYLSQGMLEIEKTIEDKIINVLFSNNKI